jgi:hypothetical protein
MRLTRIVVGLCLGVLLAAVPAGAQDFRGRINGTVTDNTGAVLPGVTVTAVSPALIQPQVQVTGDQGDFRFLALPPGVYEVSFDLAGFQSVRREGIRVVINQTLTVDQQLQVATLQETVTVTGASPIVDTSTTTLATNFTAAHARATRPGTSRTDSRGRTRPASRASTPPRALPGTPGISTSGPSRSSRSAVPAATPRPSPVARC